MLVQEVARLLPSPLPMPSQPLPTFSSSYLFQADSNVQNGHSVLYLLPEVPCSEPGPCWAPGPEEFYMASPPGDESGEKVTDTHSERGILSTYYQDVQSVEALPWAGDYLPGGLVGKASWRQSHGSTALLLPGS